jgi:hypothetical protein
MIDSSQSPRWAFFEISPTSTPYVGSGFALDRGVHVPRKGDRQPHGATTDAPAPARLRRPERGAVPRTCDSDRRGRGWEEVRTPNLLIVAIGRSTLCLGAKPQVGVERS